MTVIQKKLRLTYKTEEKGKQVSKNYSYEVDKSVSNENIKEVGQLLGNLIKDTIEDYTLVTTETL